MKFRFTKDAEKDRIKDQQNQRQSSWEIYKTTSLVEVVHKAKDLGWKNNEVQVRVEKIDSQTEMYYIEPFERNCGCRGILKYNQYFN